MVHPADVQTRRPPEHVEDDLMGLFEALKRLRTLERVVIRLCERVTALEKGIPRETPSGVNRRNDEPTVQWKRGEGDK